MEERSPDTEQDPVQEPILQETVQQPENASQRTSPSAIWAWAIELSETVLPAIVIAVLINLFLAQATRVYGHSMEPNLHTDQRLVVEKLSYRLHTPRRTDVVVLHIPDHSKELLIKRVIALAGETIQVKNGGVYINGELLDEPYLNVETRGSYGPLTIPPDHVFVMGDNRGASNDSRSFGPVHISQVVGRAWVSYWPIEVFGSIK
ncbi:MAG: signal peptidase I [Anaerolineae bacterium]|nr:signal peptidase I [Anaerolineae bacterium]